MSESLMNHHGMRARQIVAEHDQGPEYAHVQCTGSNFACTTTERVEWSAALADDQITALLSERGWTVDPTHCPEHATTEGLTKCN